MRFFIPLAALLLAGCGSSNRSGLEDLRTTPVTLPGGRTIRAELMVTPDEQQRGMMFREALPPDRALLFVHTQASPVTYWMYQVKVPLDIVFMNSDKRVLGVSADTPPCTTRASLCPNYGGYPGTRYVLEMRAGEAARNGVKPGTTLAF